MIKHQLIVWLKNIWLWLAEGKLVFMCLLVIASAILLGFVTWSSELSIRATGYALQFIGMLFAIRGLLCIRAHFGQPLLRELFFNWIKRFPKWKIKVVTAGGTVQLPGIEASGRVDVWSADNPDLPLEERVEKIISNQEKLRSGQCMNTQLIDDLSKNYEMHKKKITEQTQNFEEDIRTELESLHTSDLITSLVGLVWLTIGITMSTMSQELYRWLY